MRPFAKWSIEWKLPLGGALLLLVVVGILSTAAYREVRRGARAVAGARLASVTNQFAQVLGTSTSQLASYATLLASRAEVKRQLLDPSDRARAAAVAALTYRGAQIGGVAATELWDSAGRRVIAIGPFVDRLDPAATRRLIIRLDPRDSARVGPFQPLGDSIAFATVAPVVDGRLLGYVVHWSRLTASPQSRAQTMQLVGSEASLYLGNRDGGLWTDLVHQVAGPPPSVAGTQVIEYRRPNSGDRLGLIRPIPGAPWSLLIEFAESVVSDPADRFLARLALIAGLLLAVALAIVWTASHWISRPLRDLTVAAEAVAGADFSRRVEVTRSDELGRLATVFNGMVDRLDEARNRLEDKVRERTSRLEETLGRLKEGERRLQEAKEGAEQASRAKSDFLAKMSHELRTPLNSIIGFSEVLEDRTFGPLNDKQARYVSNVLTSGRQLLELINDILDLSKVEAGRMELYVDRFSLSNALVEVRSIVVALADPKRISVDLTIDQSLPPLAADQAKLKQIMYNLLSNAIKFTPEGGRVAIVAQRAEDPRGLPVVEIAVSDTGIGIKPEDHARIFEEFEQIDSPFARELRGTGLGLALTRRLIELHGGRIWLESMPNAGSTFYFTLPLSAGALPEQADERFLGALEVPVPQGTTVLVVDDDDKARELLRHYLAGAGYHVVEARTGDEAIELASELHPDAITLDIMLPGRHGHEVLAMLKSDPRTLEIPVVVVSMTEDRELGLSLGAADWLVKPTRREDFIASVRRASAKTGSKAPVVLVIDDEPATIEFLTDLLTHQGFRVVPAAGGNVALAHFDAAKPDVIVVDLVMPEMTGLEVVEAIRARPEGRTTPIVVFTVKELTRDERRRLERSVQAIVLKGRGRGALLRVLEQLTRRAAVGV
jgi:signal transduction histidine kinase/CheY-like chemotaxis protein